MQEKTASHPEFSDDHVQDDANGSSTDRDIGTQVERYLTNVGAMLRQADIAVSQSAALIEQLQAEDAGGGRDAARPASDVFQPAVDSQNVRPGTGVDAISPRRKLRQFI